MEIYDYNEWSKTGSSSVKELVDRAVSDVANEVASWPNFGDKYADRIRALKGTLLSRVIEAVSREGSTFNVLNHGSCWYNNLMFRYNNSTSQAEEVHFVSELKNFFLINFHLSFPFFSFFLLLSID